MLKSFLGGLIAAALLALPSVALEFPQARYRPTITASADAPLPALGKVRGEDPQRHRLSLVTNRHQIDGLLLGRYVNEPARLVDEDLDEAVIEVGLATFHVERLHRIEPAFLLMRGADPSRHRMSLASVAGASR